MTEISTTVNPGRPLNGRLRTMAERTAVWIQAKVCDHELGLWPRLNAGSVTTVLLRQLMQ